MTSKNPKKINIFNILIMKINHKIVKKVKNYLNKNKNHYMREQIDRFLNIQIRIIKNLL